MEVKTFKCDICGEAFYSSNDKPGFGVHMFPIGKVDATDKYDHVCPKCASVIDEIIRHPDVLKNERGDRAKAEVYADDLEYTINDLHNDVFGEYHMLMGYRTRAYALSRFKEMCKEIKTEYFKLKKSHLIWKTIAFALIG